MIKSTLLLFLSIVALTACQPTIKRKPAPTDVPPVALTQTAEAVFQGLHNHEGAIRFMSYNIENGGVPFDEAGPDNLNDGRVLNILEVIRASNPDVILIQESNGWDFGDPPIVKQIADELGMQYYAYCKSRGNPNEPFSPDSAGLDNVIISKFPILDWQSYETLISWCALRVKIVLPSGQEVNVFSTHIEANTTARCNELTIRPLSELSGEHTSGAAVLMGDFNILDGFVEGQVPRQVCYDLLSGAGWIFVYEHTVDIIFLSQGLLDLGIEYQVMSNLDNPLFDHRGMGDRRAADHEPVIVDIFFPAE